MIAYLLLGFCSFLIAYALRVKRTFFYRVALASLSLLNELISEEDEDSKIDGIQKRTNALLFALLKLIVLLALAFLIGSSPIFVYVQGNAQEFSTFSFGSFYSILSISIGASIPFLIPLTSTSEYSELSQLLHRLFLDNYNIADKLFSWERKRMAKKGLSRNVQFVIVTGLARAGTTSLMLNLSKIDQFSSLSYANMPLLTAPNLWRKIYTPKSKKLKERSHQDGILIGLESKEALEEYFFKMKTKDAFIQDNFLVQHVVSDEVYEAYLDYQSIVKNDNEKIYLAKNNNFILRYKSMRQRNSQFLVLLLFRDPLSHAASLLDKHRYYVKSQQEDPFVLEYMNWLGHHEFGNNQKAFSFSEDDALSGLDKNSINYWLASWINYYTQALKMQDEQTLFLNYKTYCNSPNEVLQLVLNKVHLDLQLPKMEPYRNTRKADVQASENLMKEAEKLYVKLCALSDVQLKHTH